ncbi:hypothetical protein D9M72_528720 [compost metagenome]
MAGCEGGATDFTSPPIDAARQIDRDDREPARVDPFNGLNDVPREIAREPGPEQRVDDDIAGPEFDCVKRRHRSLPFRPCACGVALKCRGIAECKNRDIRPTFRKTACRDITIAAIVARPAEHEETEGIREVSQGRRGHGQAGIAHQREAFDAGLGGRLIDRRHFRGRDQQVLKFGAHVADLSTPGGMTQGLTPSAPFAP